MAPHYIGGKVPGWNVPDPGWNGCNPLTAPIAYLTTFPNDPFAKTPRVCPESRQYLYVNRLYAIKTVGWPIFHLTYREYGSYRIHSRGPYGNGPDTGIPYDPTNGIVSNGDIIYAQKTGFADYIPFPIVPDE